ncbi:MAG: cysteine desulfurase, partial [Streptococcus salivarius]|nr:cysteine desulfurase [Streptococcus salivarius]
VVLNDGITFGSEGEKHFRFNVATPTTVVTEGVKRLVSVFGK